jgi:hypothetical protein
MSSKNFDLKTTKSQQRNGHMSSHERQNPSTVSISQLEHDLKIEFEPKIKSCGTQLRSDRSAAKKVEHFVQFQALRYGYVIVQNIFMRTHLR